MQVTAIWRYPVKSMQGEALTTAEVGRRGIDGDRHWALRDAETGLILTARREPALLMATARCTPDGDVAVQLPGGETTRDDARLTAWLGRPVTLETAADDKSGEYEIAVDGQGRYDEAPDAETGEWTGEWMTWRGPRGSFHDSTRTAVSIVGKPSVGDWPMARFRPNIAVDVDERLFLEAGSIRIGTTVLAVKKPIDRCVVVTRPQPGLERAVDILRTINKTRDGNLGVGALVSTPGTIRIGDAIEVA